MNVRLKLPAVRHFVESTPWAIQREKGMALLEVLEVHAQGGTLTRDAAALEARTADRRPVTKSGGAIAVLSLQGVISQRMNMMMEYCGGTSTERFADEFDAAMADPNVSAIVIDCNSPGGNVQGTPELAKRILAARGKGKQIVAVANGTMASAAYWICSAADEIVASPSAEVGSIGVFCVHVDQSAMNEMVGLKYTLIKAGEHKAEGNPFEPLAADAEAFIQGQVDEMNDMFVSTVAKQRGTDAKTVNADYGQGRCLTARQALAAGMIDRVATLEETLKRLGAKNVGASGRPVVATGVAHQLQAGFQASADLADATEPKYAAGDRVVATVDHMAGMKGMAGAVHEANAGAPPYYSVDFDEPMGEGNPHKWLNEDEIEPEAADANGDTMDDHMARISGPIQILLGQGRCLTAKQALAAGLIDRVATLEETLKRLGAKNVGASGRPVVATGGIHLLQAGDLPDPAADSEDGAVDDDGLCPECGAETDEDGDCTACDYEAASAETAVVVMAEPAQAADLVAHLRASGTTGPIQILPPTAGAVDPGATQSPDLQPLAAEHPMDEILKKALEAERKRAASIRAVARDHQIDEARIDALVDSGVSEDAASTQILSEVRARHVANPAIRVGADRAADRKFDNAGEQLVAVIQRTKFGKKDARLDRVNYTAMQTNRADAMDLMAGSPAGMNESVGSEGGFFIAPEVLPEIMKPVYTDDPILSRVKRIPIGSASNRTVYNVVDETARTDGNRWGGVQFFWGDEADTAAAKKPKMRQVEQLLKKLIGITYLTDEMLEDAPAAQALVMEAFNAELQFTLANSIFRGKGGGQMLGFLNGKGGVAQAIEATQTIANTSTFVSQNVAKMKTNIPAALWGDLIWLYNQELLASLMNATIGTTSIPVFVPAAGMAGQGAVDRILGAPAYASELCEAPGTPGDIICIAPSQYHMAEKGGIQVATSIHVQFLTDQTALRFTQRVDGKPVWNSTVTPFKGSTARGFLSTLAARA
jgi:HK97 family phage major capsid protein